jgi:putative transcriptional regulator
MTEPDQIEQMAALHAVGALDPEEAAEFRNLLAARHPRAVREAAACAAITDLMAVAFCEAKAPPPQLRQGIMDQVRASLKRDEISGRIQNFIPPSLDGFTFIRETTVKEGWKELPVPGARMKVLSVDPAVGSVTALVRLEAGAHYPMHRHRGPEQVYLVEGDFHIGNQVLRTGDFHRAEAGTTHGVSHTESGCTMLVMVSLDDLVAQFVA